MVDQKGAENTDQELGITSRMWDTGLMAKSILSSNSDPSRSSKEVKFSNKNKIILIETRDEYIKAKIKSRIWWCEDDYCQFKNEAIGELKELMCLDSRIDSKIAQNILYQAHLSINNWNDVVRKSKSCVIYDIVASLPSCADSEQENTFVCLKETDKKRSNTTVKPLDKAVIANINNGLMGQTADDSVLSNRSKMIMFDKDKILKSSSAESSFFAEEKSYESSSLNALLTMDDYQSKRSDGKAYYPFSNRSAISPLPKRVLNSKLLTSGNIGKIPTETSKRDSKIHPLAYICV